MTKGSPLSPGVTKRLRLSPGVTTDVKLKDDLSFLKVYQIQIQEEGRDSQSYIFKDRKKNTSESDCYRYSRVCIGSPRG